jgi:hypothetical protein
MEAPDDVQNCLSSARVSSGEYNGTAGSFCTITASNLSEIPIGTREFGLKDADLVAGTFNSDGVLGGRFSQQRRSP